MNCFKCGKKVGQLSNYGDKNKPICYDCASLQCCEECKCSIPVGEHVKDGSKLLCKKCYTLILQNKNAAEKCAPVQECNKPTGECIRFDTDPFYLRLVLSSTVLIAVLLFLNQLHVFTSEVATNLYITIILTVLFLVTLIAGVKIRKNFVITVTSDSLLIGSHIIPVKSISSVEFQDSQIVIFNCKIDGKNRKRTMYVSSIVLEQQERFKQWIREFQGVVDGKNS